MQDPKSQPAHIEVFQIEVLPATPEQKPVVANLLELYAHDFSDFQDLELGPDGRLGYRDLDLYWSEPGHHPFLIKVDGKLAGVGSSRQGCESSRVKVPTPSIACIRTVSISGAC